jgi:hypothetical protein
VLRKKTKPNLDAGYWMLDFLPENKIIIQELSVEAGSGYD